MMKGTGSQYFRLIFQGLTVPKVVNPYHIRSLQIAKDIQSGTMPELELHQRNIMKKEPMRRCYITKFLRPGIHGFQCFHHCDPRDTVIEELDTDGVCVSEYLKRSSSNPPASKAKGKAFGKAFEKVEIGKHFVCLGKEPYVQMVIKSSGLVEECLPPCLQTCYRVTERRNDLAIVTQRVTVPYEAYKVFEQGKIGGYPHLSCFTPTDRELSPSNYSGNRYQVVLRRIPFREQKAVICAIDCVRQSGFLNYFPPNYFSHLTRNKNLIGGHVLRREFRAIVQHLLENTSSRHSLQKGRHASRQDAELSDTDFGHSEPRNSTLKNTSSPLFSALSKHIFQRIQDSNRIFAGTASDYLTIRNNGHSNILECEAADILQKKHIFAKYDALAG